MGNPILDTISTSELFGTTQPSPNYDIFMESSNRAETWHIGFSYMGNPILDTIFTSGYSNPFNFPLGTLVRRIS